MAGMTVRHHLTILLPSGGLRDEIETERARWDPVMAGGVPAHVTAVYPEEVTEFDDLLARVGNAIEGLRAFPLDARGIAADHDSAGVFVGVTDRTGALQELRARLLPTGRSRAYPLHATIVHPRTSARGPEAIAALGARRLSGSFLVAELVWTETASSPEGATMTVRRRFPLGPPRVQNVAAVLRRDGRALLCHRVAGRASFPDTWDLPGGHVEAGEHGAVALARELHEELGIVVDDLPDVPTHVFTDDALGVDLCIWYVDEWSGTPVNAAPEEHDELAWCAAPEWSSRPLAHPGYRELLADAVLG